MKTVYDKFLGQHVKLENASRDFLIENGYIPGKKRNTNASFNFISPFKSFVTTDITGEPVEVHTRSHEKDLLKRHGLVHYDVNSKAKNRLNVKNSKRTHEKGVEVEDLAKIKKKNFLVRDHFEKREVGRESILKEVMEKYAK